MVRFSLKWILAAMVYAAIAAAAFSQESWVYADLLCAASLLALGYAVLLTIYARGQRQAAAAGFAVLMVLLAACILLAPQSVPTLRIVLATGVGQTPILPTPSTPAPATWTAGGTFSGGTLSLRQSPNLPASIAPGSAWAVATTPTVYSPAAAQLDITHKLRAANAVATMTLGLVGALLGLLAYSRARIIAGTPRTPSA